MEILFLFVSGTVIGSFLNVVVFRLGTGERIGNARSRCFSCGKTLVWYELVPLLSFLIQKGKCRKCGSKISLQYPIVEFMMGLIFVLVAWKVFENFSAIGGSTRGGQFSIFKLVYFLTIFSLLLTISVYDFRHKIIPNQLVYPFIVLSFFGVLIIGNWEFIENWKLIIENFFLQATSGFLAFLFFASLWFFSKGKWMGFGDAKLALGIGFLLGPWLATVAILLSFWIGTLIAVPFVLFWGGGLKTQIPFGPFLAAGAFVSWFAGEAMLEAYRLLLF